MAIVHRNTAKHLASVRELWARRSIRAVRTSGRTKIIGATCGLIVCAVGVAWLLVKGPGPYGTILTIAGAIFAASMVVSWWIYRPQK
jgi:ABC-type sulfate transport system permease component